MGTELYNDDFKVNCNIVLVGKSGAGKSSLANYLFGTDRFTTGCGKPVTTWEENFQQYFFDIDGVQINIYDSVGLEPNNVSVWMEKFDKFLESKGSLTNNTSVVDANKMMHLIIYVVNGGSGRFEDAEKLKEISQRHNVKTAVAITNCDTASEDQISGIEKIAHDLRLDTARVCSISRKTRGGEQKEAFGKENLIRKILSASYNAVGRKLMIGVLNKISKKCLDTKLKIQDEIKNSSLSIFNTNSLENFGTNRLLDEISEILYINGINDIEKFIPSNCKSYCHFIEKFRSYLGKKDEFSHYINIISHFIDTISDSIDKSLSEFMKFTEEIENKVKNGTFLEKVELMSDAPLIFLFLKKSITAKVEIIFSGIMINKINLIRDKLLANV